MEKVNCPICKTEINDNPYDEICPKCKWTYTGIENVYEENEKDDFNGISRKEAKQLYSKGLNKYGEKIK